VLTLSGLTVRYGRSVQALHGIDLELAAGSVLAVLGSNGAGKTTLLRAVSGTLGLHRGTLTGGTITLEGDRIDRLDAAAVVRRGVVQVPENRQIFTRMTVEENLRAGTLATPAASRGAARDRVYGLFPELADRGAQRAGLLSGGEQQMLAIGRALMSQPKILLLDEPSLGLAPRLVTRIGRIVAEIHQQGTAVVLVEQNATMALRVASAAAVLEVGRVALRGPSGELARTDEVQRLYLGGHAESDREAAAYDAAAAAAPRRTLTRWQR
jgi:branched-chain amino acid transport system ATP-binding protein